MTIKDIFHHLNELSDEELDNLCPVQFAEDQVKQLLTPTEIKIANFEIATMV